MNEDDVAFSGLIYDAIWRIRMERGAVAAELGVAYQTLDGWMRGEKRFPVVKLGALTRILGPWLVNRLLEPHGFRAVKLLENREDSDPFASIREAALRLPGASGRVTTEVADATDPSGPGGEGITREEGDRIRSSIRDARAYLDEMEERLNTATSIH